MLIYRHFKEEMNTCSLWVTARKNSKELYL